MQPCDFVVFGALGDLATRKLVPSLYQLDKAELLEPEMLIVGVARKENMGENPRSRPGFRRKKRKRRSLPADE